MAAARSGGMCLCGRGHQPEPQACQSALPAAAVPTLPPGPLFPLSTLPSCTGQSTMACGCYLVCTDLQTMRFLFFHMFSVFAMLRS